MKPILYYWQDSPPARTVMLLIRYLNLDIEIQEVTMEFFASKEFELLNPSKKIPVLKDGDFLLSESTAICHYLILKNNIDKRLLGESITEKALVTHRICYNVGTLFQKLYDICHPLYAGTSHEIENHKKQAVEHEFEILNKLLSEYDWAATNYVTLADLSLVTVVTSLQETGFDLSKHVNVINWLKKCETLPGWDENIKGSKAIASDIKRFAPNAF